MQSQLRWSEGTAVLGDHTTADQFQLVSGQIVLQLSGDQKLYLHGMYSIYYTPESV
jgi:hypothetical protein